MEVGHRLPNFMHCLECGITVAGNSESYEQQGFCSNDCSRKWESWRLREKSRHLPGLSDLFDDENSDPSVEQLMLYVTVYLGCGLYVVRGNDDWKVIAALSWNSGDVGVFADGQQAVFSKIDGFLLDTGDETISRRLANVAIDGKDLTHVCLILIDEIHIIVARFVRECDRWGMMHIDELEAIVDQYRANHDLSFDEDEGYENFISWLDLLCAKHEKHRA